ncbi:MAG: hypothetical protein WKF84_00670 [Pyrinomonadaceae bacterium]
MPMNDTTLSVVPVMNKRSQHAAEREDRARNDRNRVRERAKLDEQHDEDERDCQHKRE